MIYFLVNNTYHLELDLRLAEELTDKGLGLIQVPLALGPIVKHSMFNRVLCFENVKFASLTKFLRSPCAKVKIERKLDLLLQIEQSDILLVHSEIPSMNQLLIQKFYDKGAKVFLLEDGPATIVDNNWPIFETPLSNKIRTFFLRRIQGLRYSSILKIGDQNLPRMEDFIFEGIIVNYGDEINRDINLYTLRQKKEIFEIVFEKGALFLSQPLYKWYLSEDDYVNYIDEILHVSERFEPFYFKFHPSDSIKVKEAIENILVRKYSKIILIKEQETAEKLIMTYRVRYAISVNSTVLVNLVNKNITPIFLNQLFFREFPSVESESFSNFLGSFNCYSPNDYVEVRPGFKALRTDGMKRKTYSISEILNLER